MQFNEYNGWNPPIYVVRPPRKYGFFRFMFDICMIIITSGLWLIWIFVREMRRR